MEVMGLNRAHSHCTHTRDPWRKGSPYFSMGVGLCSWDHLLESRSAALRPGKSWQEFPGGRKQEYCTESKTALDFMNHQNTEMMPSNL